MKSYISSHHLSHLTMFYVSSRVHMQVSIWNRQGDTPLTLAVRLSSQFKSGDAACAMLEAGFDPCQLASVYLPEEDRDETVHALLLAARVSEYAWIKPDESRRDPQRCGLL